MIDDILNEIDALKMRLDALRNSEYNIRNQIERLEYVENQLQGIGSPSMSDMPKAHGKDSARVEYLIEKKDGIVASIATARAEREKEAAWLTELLDKLQAYNGDCHILLTAEEAYVMRLWYIDRLPAWADVAFTVFGDKPDYCGRDESYEKRARRMRKRAVEKIARHLVDEKPKSKNIA